MFLNTLTAEYKYSRRNMQTFVKPVQTPLSFKKKPFSGLFIAFWNLYEMENIFKKKREFSSLSISVFSSQYADFRETSSDAIIFQKKAFFWTFYCVSEIYMKWRTFSKKNESFLA